MTQDPAPRLGKYIIIEEIGRGGFGIVYRAEDTSLGNRIVALKVLHPQLVVDPTSVHLFSEEAGTAARIEHPHIVTIYETDIHEQRRYIAMKYLPGPSLAQVLQEEGAQPLEQVVAWVGQIAAALDHAHGAGIIHRDLKPSNVLLDTGGQVVVTDFGLARAAEASGGISSSRDSGIMTGTARYMAPEQARGKATRQSDVYSLGIVTYELLTGHVPFEEGDAFALAYQHIHEAPPPLRDFCPDLPEEIERVVLQALEKDPAGRHGSAGEFAQALDAALKESRARQQRKKKQDTLYGLLLDLEKSGDWRKAVETARRIESNQPGYHDVPQRLEMALRRVQEQERAEQQRLAEQERQQKLTILYDTLLDQEKAEDWPAVVGLARQILAEEPGYRDVAQRQARAEKEQRKTQAQREAERQREEAERQARVAALWRRAVLAGLILSAVAGLGLLGVWLGKQIVPPPDQPTPTPTKTQAPTFTDVASWETPASTSIDLAERIADSGTGTAWASAVAPEPTSTLTPSATLDPTSAPVPTPSFTPVPEPTATPSPSTTSTSVPKQKASATWTVQPDTPTPTPVPPSPAAGTLTGRIAFSVMEPGSNTYILYSIKPDGTDLRWLGNNLRQPSYRHDGEVIVANGQGGGRDDLWKVNPNGSGTIGSMGHLDDEHPVWLQSRRGYHVGCDSLRWGDGQWRIYLGDAPISYGSGGVLGRFPVGLPGELVVYQGCNYGFGNGSRCGLFKVSMWGGIPTQLLDDPNDISTGGGAAGALFMRQEKDNWDVYLIAPTGGTPRRLTDHAARDGLATFSPDGKTIAFLSDRSGGWAIWLMGRDGSDQHKIYGFPAGWNYADWTTERISWGPLLASPTPAPTAVGGDLLDPPTFIWPRAEDVIQAARPYNIQWSWDVRSLGENEGFEVRLRQKPTDAPAALATPLRETSLGVTFAYSPIYHAPGYYYLDIVVVQISPRKELSRSAGPIRIKLEGE